MVKKIHATRKNTVRRASMTLLAQERDNPDVIAYLDAENRRAAKEMAHTKAFEERLFEEIKARIKQTDMSVPYRRDGYFYYTRYEEGKEYPIYARKHGSLDSPEEIMLDANVLAQGHEYFSIGGWAVSSGRNILAYAVDTEGRRIYSIHFKKLTTGELLPEVILEVTRTDLGQRQPDPFLRQAGPDDSQGESDFSPWARRRPGGRSFGIRREGRDLRRLCV
jgi:protease II